MPVEIKVPMLPESVSDATMLHWHVQVGQTVRRDDNLVDIETEKVVLEVPAPRDGVITEILCAEGDIVLADDVIALFDEGAEAPVATQASAAEEDPVEETVPEEPLQESPPLDTPPSPTLSETPAVPAATSPSGPAVKHLAAAEGVKLTDIQGTGRGGRILKSDVQAYAGQSSTPAETILMPHSKTWRTIRSLLRYLATVVMRSISIARTNC